ncbi:phosphatidylserine decarboxylase family protein [Rhodohalobacter sp. SW132]|uniref:phosphatidylserine decarboxylase family protein n=1 Tax=Rhodohalobacter sp. SW132 TaxID=2293433 RepID=UPI000E269BD5|nr:phosphatidylserine decarboxylase family protein [Rhodohalobacter sp. SW132]REL38204.1 phosphatidylserine decarboxylase family protein [Rhodohalobacter sp. SW132]
MIAKDGYSTIVVVAIFSIVVAFGASYLPNLISIIIYILLFILFGLTVYFFRDPERVTPDDENLIISPADGKVVLIKEAKENEYLNQNVTQVSIFLSPLNVHVNRVPISGTVEYVRYSPGKYLMAWEDHASEENERAHFGVVHPSGVKILFKQITGFLARRIVYRLEEGNEITAGERFGIMKFGSRMDLLLPDNVEILVKKGEKTVAGESVIGRIRQS